MKSNQYPIDVLLDVHPEITEVTCALIQGGEAPFTIGKTYKIVSQDGKRGIMNDNGGFGHRSYTLFEAELANTNKYDAVISTTTVYKDSAGNVYDTESEAVKGNIVALFTKSGIDPEEAKLFYNFLAITPEIIREMMDAIQLAK